MVTEITHLRYAYHGKYQGLDFVSGPDTLKNLDENGNHTVYPRGGKTVCQIFDDEGQLLASAAANCSLNDNYNKRLGRMIAEGRAKAALAKKMHGDNWRKVLNGHN